MKMAAFWDDAQYILTDIVRRFRGTYCLNNQGYEMNSVTSSETRVNIYQTALCNITEDSNLQGDILFVRKGSFIYGEAMNRTALVKSGCFIPHRTFSDMKDVVPIQPFFVRGSI
jgi:hypothetical protein